MKVPYFEDKWEFAPRSDKETIKRKNVFAIVEHPTEEKYMLLDWEKTGWKSFVVWWVEDEETYEEWALRETLEETWFIDVAFTKVIAWPFWDKFFASHKDVNRFSKEYYVLVKLNSLKQVEVNEEEVKNHKAVWIDKKDVETFLNLDNNLYAWRIFSSWKKEDLEYLNSLEHFKWFVEENI